MFVVDNYPLAVGSLLHHDALLGLVGPTPKKHAGPNGGSSFSTGIMFSAVVILSLISALTLGSFGELGRGFCADLRQADWNMVISAIIGGMVFNLANILLVAAIAIAGMAVAFSDRNRAGTGHRRRCQLLW